MPITSRFISLPSRTVGFALLCTFLACFSSAACSKSPASNPQQAAGDPAGGGAGGRAGGGGGGARGGRGGGGPVPVVTTHAVAKPVPVTIPAVGTAEPVATVQI